MKKIIQFFRKLVCGRQSYRYYLVVLTEKYTANNDVADTYVSGNIFRSEEEAAIFIDWLMEHTEKFGTATIEVLDTHNHHLCARLHYPTTPEEKVTITYVEPIENT